MEIKLCKCGCGRKVYGFNKKLKKPTEFIHGHNRPWLGKHHNNKTKRKIGLFNLGKKYNEKTKRKMSESKKGKLKIR